MITPRTYKCPATLRSETQPFPDFLVGDRAASKVSSPQRACPHAVARDLRVVFVARFFLPFDLAAVFAGGFLAVGFAAGFLAAGFLATPIAGFAATALTLLSRTGRSPAPTARCVVLRPWTEGITPSALAPRPLRQRRDCGSMRSCRCCTIAATGSSFARCSTISTASRARPCCSRRITTRSRSRRRSPRRLRPSCAP